MYSQPTFDELRSRINDDIDHFRGQLPERYAIAWGGYIAALLEWGAISVDDHARLFDMLPRVENNPVLAILLGRPNDYSD